MTNTDRIQTSAQTMAQMHNNFPIGKASMDKQILLKDMPPKDPPPDLPPCTYGTDIMQYIYCLLQLALHHTHVFQHWHTVWNMYLKKSPATHKLMPYAHCTCLKLIITSYSNGIPPKDSWLKQNATTACKTIKVEDARVTAR